MTVTDTPLSLTVERTIKAPPETVFDAWLDPEMLMRFMQPGPGMTTPQAENDPQVGGRFDLVMRNADTDIPHGGIYKVIDRPNRLVFSWETPFSVEGSTVTIEFRPAGEGTHVTLTHVRFPDEESRSNHENGWAAILARLEETL